MIPAHKLIAEASVWWWPRITDHLWQATIFALVVVLTAIVLRGGPARIRHSLWLIASAKFVIPVSLLFLFSQVIGLDKLWLAFTSTTTESNAVLRGITGPGYLLSNNYEVTVTATAARHTELYCVLTAIWFLGCAVVCGSRLWRRTKFRRALKEGRWVEQGREWLALKQAQEALRLDTHVQLVLSPLQLEPAVYRVRRPVIVLPATIAEHLTDDELAAIMLHELVHIQRRDNLIGKLQLALSALFWFHPLVWFINRKLYDEREQACDETVVEIFGAPDTYAASILKVVRFSFGWKVAGVTSAGGGSNLRRRIENIMSTGSNKHSKVIALRLLTAAALTLTLLVMVVAGGSNRTRGTDLITGEVASATVSHQSPLIQPVANSRQQDESRQGNVVPPQPPPPPAAEQPPQPQQPEKQPPSPPQPATPAQPAQPANSDNPASPPEPPQPPARPSRPAAPQDKQDVKGELIEAPKPVYPDEAKRQKVEGLVTVEIVIGEDGTVVSASPRSGHELLQGAAKEAALKARFKPTLVNGKPAKVSGAMTYNFKLDEKEKTE